MCVDFRQITKDIIDAGRVTETCKKIGITPQFFYQIARGERGEPRYKVGKKLISEHRKIKKGAS